MMLHEYKNRHRYSKESIRIGIMLYLSEYLDAIIKSADNSSNNMPGYEKKLKALHDLINTLNQLDSL